MANLLKKYHLYSDGGHGWLKVSLADLAHLGIADKITRFSYLRGDWAYLEEDQDAGTFIEAWMAATGKTLQDFWKLEKRHYSDDSKIRRYDLYRAHTADEITFMAKARKALKAKFPGRTNAVRLGTYPLESLRNLAEKHGVAV